MTQLLFLILFSLLLASCNEKDASLSQSLPIISESEENPSQIDGEFFLLEKFLKPNDIVFDIGAHIGTWSKKAFTIQPHIHLIAFEPIPEVFARLKKDMGRKGLSVYNLAISDCDGRSEFFFYNQDWQTAKLSSFYKRSVERNSKKIEPVTIHVEQETLDHFCHIWNIDAIDLVKIATEGSEMRILYGARDLLRQRKIRAIQFEHDPSFRNSGSTLKEVMKYLTDHNYVLFRMTGSGIIHIDEWKRDLEQLRHANFFAIQHSEVPEFQKTENLDTLQTSIWK